jgi:hypothetical protein
MPVLDAIEAMSRVLALSDGRDPSEATQADRDRGIDFLNVFHAANWWARQRDPCTHCRGSGIEPQRGATPAPAVIKKTAA